MTALTPSAAALSDSPRRLGSAGDRVFRLSLIVGVVLLAVSVGIGLLSDMSLDRFMKSYLIGFAFVLTICLGALFFTLVQHITRAGWSASVRRVAETIAANLQWIWILFIPILVTALMGKGDVLYSWMNTKKIDPDYAGYDFLYDHKSAYLNVGFWVFRAVVFFTIWAVASRFYYRTSVAQDADGDPRRTLLMQKLAPIGILAFAFTITFASIDWLMAIEAHWFSTMFGVYFFAMCACSFFATFPIVFHLLQRAGKIQNEVTLEHYQDMGKLLFGFGIVFHAYIGFSQFMLLWYANIPESTGWYITRTAGPWLPLMYLLPIGHFAIPFVLVISKHVKRMPKLLALIASWMLVMHFVDLYLVVMPTVPTELLEELPSFAAWRESVASGEVDLGFAPNPIDLTLVLGLTALATAATVRRLGSAALIPERDPRLHEATHFENL